MAIRESVATGCWILLAHAAAVSAVAQAGPVPTADPVQEGVRTRLEAPGARTAAGDALLATVALPASYEALGYAPIWVANATVSPRARRLIREIERAEEEGLRPAAYHLEALRRLTRQLDEQPGDAAVATDLELLLSDAFLVLGSHYLSGRVDPASIHSAWVANRRNVDMAAVLSRVANGEQPDLVLRELLPAQPGYARLRTALARYGEIRARGGWPAVPAGPPLRVDDVGDRVAVLQRRLESSGDLASGAYESGIFGESTDAAVRWAQQRHGLAADGVVGQATLAALKVPVEERIRQVVVNLERWRWLPQELGARHVIVNIANYELDVVEAGREVMTMRVAVGRPYRKSPVFSDRITHLVLSPYWHVPFNLAVQDKLPDIQREGPGWFGRNNMRVFRDWGSEARELDPATVDWERLSATNFPYRLRQDPGPRNALGRVKFMFPNAFNVYLHDTPGRDVFTQDERAFSSGCIRIEKPMELALHLLGGQGWTAASLQQVVDAGVERTVHLATPMPVHLLYWTAWASADGTVHFRRDIYDRDGPLAAALQERPPRPGR